MTAKPVYSGSTRKNKLTTKPMKIRVSSKTPIFSSFMSLLNIEEIYIIFYYVMRGTGFEPV